jgi:hypothetical protein
MKKIILSAIMSGTAFAGGTGGGSTPPLMSEEMLTELANSNVDFKTLLNVDKPLLYTNKELQPIMRLSAVNSVESMKIMNSDALLLDKMKISEPFIDVVSPQKTIQSYRIEDGDLIGDFKLMDRRKLMRENLKSK